MSMTEQSQQIGDDMMIRVMQYCDGALPPAEAEQVAREIAADPSLQTLANDLKRGAETARDAMAVIERQPVPFALARAVAGAANAPAAQPWYRGQVAAAAIGLLVGAGVLGIWSASHETDGMRLAGAKPTDEAMAPNGFRVALLSALEAGPALTTHSYVLADQGNVQGEVSVLRWFDLATGATCAEFNQVESARVLAGGLACRNADGWEIVTIPSAQK
jgi:surface antigen